MNRGLVLDFSDGVRFKIITILENGFKFSKNYIPQKNIKKITFTNKHPEINGSYIANRNQMYCVIDYVCCGETNTIYIKPITNIWSDLQSICINKFVDETNGESIKLAPVFVFGKGFEINKKGKRILFKIWNISFPFLAVLSLLVEDKLDYGTVPIIPLCVFGTYILVGNIMLLRRNKDKTDQSRRTQGTKNR